MLGSDLLGSPPKVVFLLEAFRIIEETASIKIPRNAKQEV